MSVRDAPNVPVRASAVCVCAVCTRNQREDPFKLDRVWRWCQKYEEKGRAEFQLTISLTVFWKAAFGQLVGVWSETDPDGYAHPAGSAEKGENV